MRIKIIMILDLRIFQQYFKCPDFTYMLQLILKTLLEVGPLIQQTTYHVQQYENFAGITCTGIVCVEVILCQVTLGITVSR